MDSFLRMFVGKFEQHKRKMSLPLKKTFSISQLQFTFIFFSILTSESLEYHETASDLKGMKWFTVLSKIIVRFEILTINGLTSRAFPRTDLTFVTIDLNDSLTGKFLFVIDIDTSASPLLLLAILMLNFDARMLFRIVSSSTSTFLFVPLSHCNDR